jgi:hypothetical protein
MGASEDRVEGETVSENAVLRVVQGLEGRSHVLVMDNYFTSPSLFLELMAHLGYEYCSEDQARVTSISSRFQED